MKEHKYPLFEEEENVGSCGESGTEYATSGSSYANMMADSCDIVPESFNPGIGPYTMEELNARIDEAEEFIAQAEKGDWRNWMTEEQSRANLYSKYPWLR